jgi:hypothetical protein
VEELRKMMEKDIDRVFVRVEKIEDLIRDSESLDTSCMKP